MSESEFTLQAVARSHQVKPKEPLFTMLISAPPASLEYLYRRLTDFDSDAALADHFPEVGLNRAEFLEQVLMVRQMDSDELLER